MWSEQHFPTGGISPVMGRCKVKLMGDAPSIDEGDYCKDVGEGKKDNEIEERMNIITTFIWHG